MSLIARPLALLCLLLIAAAPAAADPKGYRAGALGPTTGTPVDLGLHLEYLDVLGAGLVGEVGTRRYDVSRGEVHLGTVDVAGGQLLGAGLGLRAIFAGLSGVRLGVESSYLAGRFREGSLLLPDPGVVARAELLGSIGVEGTLGEILTIHTATVMGLDYADFDARPSLFYTAAIQSPGSTTAPGDSKPAAPASTHLSNTSLRLGQQVGVHIQLAKMVALYADGTFDYDGQWRVRLGIAIGRPVTRKSLDDNESPFRGRNSGRRW